MERDQTGAGAPRAEPSLGELFTRLTSDTTELVRQEVALARAEMRQVGGTLARDGARIGIALGLALAGALALTAFLVLGLGELLGDRYWLSALIVAVVLLLVGGLLARGAIADVKRRGLTPQATVNSLKEDAAWAKQEASAVKRELTR